MQLVDKLRQAKAAAIDKMENLNEAAERDNRVFSEAEVAAWDALKAEVATTRRAIEQRRGTRGDVSQRPRGQAADTGRAAAYRLRGSTGSRANQGRQAGRPVAAPRRQHGRRTG